MRRHGNHIDAPLVGITQTPINTIIQPIEMTIAIGPIQTEATFSTRFLSSGFRAAAFILSISKVFSLNSLQIDLLFKNRYNKVKGKYNKGGY